MMFMFVRERLWGSMFRECTFLAAIAFAALLIASSASGQTGGGQLAGSVTDKSGAVVAGAKVAVVNESTGSTFTTVTSSSGGYRFPSLQVGSYVVTISSPGFETEKNSGVVIETDSTTALNVVLALGSAKETVTVNADTQSLQTESIDAATLVSPELAEQLPLAVGSGEMRNAGDFVFLTPGTSGGAGTAEGNFEFRVGAGQAYGSEVLVDGATIQTADFGDGSTAELLPSIDAVQEFNVSIAGIPPQYGHTTGGIQSYTTKSGTNQFHGLAYDIFRNTALDANSWFNNAYIAQNPTDASAYRRLVDMKNEFGVTFGGPIRIPRIYDGRNKTFVFFSWEQFRQTSGVSPTETIPTAAERTGDFSALLGSAIGTDPCGQTIYNGEIFDPTKTLTSAGGVQCRQPFQYNGTLNVINPVAIGSVATNILNYFPAPTFSTLQNNYVVHATIPYNDTAETIRVDHAFSDSDKLFVSYNSRENDRVHTQTPNLPAPLTQGNSKTQDLFSHDVRIGHTHVFKSSLINQFTLGYMRIANDTSSAAVNSNYDSIVGISGIDQVGFPGINFYSTGTTAQNSLQPIGSGSIDLAANNVWDGSDSLSRTYGRHSLTVGAELRYSQYSIVNLPGAGTFNFAAGETADTVSEIGNTGNGLASFLLGDVSSATVTAVIRQPKDLGNYDALYVQDSFKVNRSLDLELGLRYDVDVPVREAGNDRSNFDPTAPNPGAGNLPGALIFAGSGAGRSGLSSRFANTWYKDFGPRVGFTYSPEAFKQKAVIRGSYSTIYGPLFDTSTGYGVGAGFQPQEIYSDTNSGNYISPLNINNGVSALPLTLNLDPAQLNGASGVLSTLRNFGRPSADQEWTLELQNQLPHGFLTTVSYIGSRATHLRSNVLYLNNLNPKYYSEGVALNATVSGVGAPYAGFSGTLAQALRPFPQYGSIDTSDTLENIGQSSYDALIAKVEHRFHSGFSLLASYTWSKQLTDADALPFSGFSYAGSDGEIQNPYNLRGEKSVSENDIPQMFVINYIYELPFGHGKRFLNSNGLLNELVGGFQVGGIQRYIGGEPFTFGCAPSVPGNDACTRYNFVPGQPVPSAVVRNHTFNPFTAVYFNPQAFSNPNATVGTTPGAAYAVGNVPRVANVFLPEFSDEDFSIIKRFSMFRESNAEFRAEFFNAFNRHSWGNPDESPLDGASFGSVTSTNTTARQVQFQLRIHY